MSGNHTPDPDEMHRWLHGMEHLVWRRTNQPLPEDQLVSECWLGTAPSWAIRAAERGESGTFWCPLLDPSLRLRTDVDIEDELSALLLE